jgi:hypothetical protein
MAKGDTWFDEPDVNAREMRNAETDLRVVHEPEFTAETTGELLEIERLTSRLEGAEGTGRSRLSARTYEPRHKPIPRQPPILPHVQF